MSLRKTLRMNVCFVKQAITQPNEKWITYCGNPSIVKIKTNSVQISLLCIVLGVGIWIASSCLSIGELAEPGRILVYGGIGNVLGINLGIKNTEIAKGIHNK